MQQTITSARAQRLSWFELGLGVFALGVAVGAVVVLMAPVQFVRMAGMLIVLTALLGVWVCAVGLKLEHPVRWHALMGAFDRRRRPGYRVPR